MVDPVLLERALQLDESERKEFIAALEDSLDDGGVTPEVAALIDDRMAAADARPDDFLRLDDFERQVRSRTR